MALCSSVPGKQASDMLRLLLILLSCTFLDGFMPSGYMPARRLFPATFTDFTAITSRKHPAFQCKSRSLSSRKVQHLQCPDSKPNMKLKLLTTMKLDSNSISDRNTEILVSEYKGILTEISKEFNSKGLRLAWVGVNQETLFDALAVQLKDIGIQRSVGRTSTAGSISFKESDAQIPGTFPKAAKQIRIDVIRHIVSHLEKLQVHGEGIERFLHAAAQLYGVQISVFEINAMGTLEISEYLPPEGAKPRGTVHLVRKGDHFISSVRDSANMADDGLFSNVPDDLAWRQIREKSSTLGFTRDVGHREYTNTNTVNHIRFRNRKDRRRFLQATVFSQAAIALESLDDQPSQDVYAALIKSLKVAGAPMKTIAVGGASQSVMDSQNAVRATRSEIIMFIASNKMKFNDIASPFKELMAMSCKYKIDITCFTLRDGLVSKESFSPPEGVSSRASITLGFDGSDFLAMSDTATVPDHSELATLPNLASSLAPLEAGSSDLAISNANSTDSETSYDNSMVVDVESYEQSSDGIQTPNVADTQEDENQERQLIWDAKSLSWKLVPVSQKNAADEMIPDVDALDPSNVDESDSSDSDSKSSFLPKFSRLRDVAKPVKAPEASRRGLTISDAVMAAELSARNSKVNIVSLQGMGARKDESSASPTPGIEKLEAMLGEQGKQIDRTDGGSNVYMCIASLMHSEGLQIQGLMFTMWGEEKKGALIGAMSRKARDDAKRYMLKNPDVFDKPGQWPGDHDLRALAHVYRLRITVFMAVYDEEVQEKVYEPDDGAEPRIELQICLDRKRFWAIRKIGKEEEVQEEEDIQIADSSNQRKPRSALEKVLAKYGNPTRQEQSGSSTASVKFDEDESVEVPIPDLPVSTVKAVRDHSATVIWLHGLAGSGQEWMNLPDALHVPWVKFMFPTAAEGSLDLWDARRVRSWFDISLASYKINCNAINALPGVVSRMYYKLQDDVVSIERNTAFVVSVRWSRAGHPMNGAAIALSAALTCSHKLGGVMLLSPWQLPSVSRLVPTWSEGEEETSKLPVLFCHGSDDEVVLASFAQQMIANSVFSDFTEVSEQRFEGIGHGLCSEELQSMRSFLTLHVPGAVSYDALHQPPSKFGKQNPNKSGTPSTGKRWGDGSVVSLHESSARFQVCADLVAASSLSDSETGDEFVGPAGSGGHHSRGCGGQHQVEGARRGDDGAEFDCREFVEGWEDQSQELWSWLRSRRHLM
eukprot:767230-Hanusia_phi.AAC.9